MMYHCVLAGSAWLFQLHSVQVVWAAREAASEKVKGSLEINFLHLIILNFLALSKKRLKH